MSKVYRITRDWVERAMGTMKPGEILYVNWRDFQEAFPLDFMCRTHEQAFLSKQIGSAWGRWKVHRDLSTGDYYIQRGVESDKRVYVDPDREHLFERMPDGSLKRRRGPDGELLW